MNITALFAGEGAATDAQASGGSLLTMLIPLALLALVFYFIIYRPQKKQERETANMRSSIELGDVIVTSGGIVGMVVKVKDDMILIETSGDRTKIQIQKWQKWVKWNIKKDKRKWKDCLMTFKLC